MPLEPCARCYRNLFACECKEGWQSDTSKSIDDTLARWKAESERDDKYFQIGIIGVMSTMTGIVVGLTVFGWLGWI